MITVWAQSAIALVLVLGAATYLAWHAWHAWRTVARTLQARRRGGCGPGCGCDTSHEA